MESTCSRLPLLPVNGVYPFGPPAGNNNQYRLAGGGERISWENECRMNSWLMSRVDAYIGASDEREIWNEFLEEVHRQNIAHVQEFLLRESN